MSEKSPPYFVLGDVSYFLCDRKIVCFYFDTACSFSVLPFDKTMNLLHAATNNVQQFVGNALLTALIILDGQFLD